MERINRDYDNIRISLESVIIGLLLVKKKKYCYWKESGEMVVRGMEMVRKDSCEVVRMV